MANRVKRWLGYPRAKYFGGKRYGLESIRHGKQAAKQRAEDMKMYWKHRRIVKGQSGDYLIYVHGKK
jgi:hypothetical protein